MRRAIAALALVAGCHCERARESSAPVVLVPPPPREPDASAAPEACGVARGPARGVAHATPGGRTFHVWTPATYDGTRPIPVVFAVHGWYSNGRDFQKWFALEKHVEDGAIVVYPDSKGHAWDVHGTSDLEFFDAMIDGLTNAYCIDRARIFALGFSYGGKMVHHLGCKRTERFKAISVGDGSWADGAPKCGRLPVLVTHRTRDDDELLAWGKDAARRWAHVNGCGPELDSTDVTHGCVAWRGCAAPVVFCEDTWFDPSWPHDWNHTIREEYLRLTWRWFASLP